MAISQATYDCLYIGKRLQEKIGDFSESEIQLFAYLSCLLALYDGKSVAFWDYIFIQNENGSPYSDDISNALNQLSQIGSLEDTDKDSYFNLTSRGDFFLEKIDKFSINSNREKYLKSAVTMVDFFPYGILTNAINNEPLLHSIKELKVRRNLLDEDGSGRVVLYEQFKLLKSVIDQKNIGLLKPAYLWLNSLAFYNENPENQLNHE